MEYNMTDHETLPYPGQTVPPYDPDRPGCECTPRRRCWRHRKQSRPHESHSLPNTHDHIHTHHNHGN
jgi:hypothetical protein